MKVALCITGMLRRFQPVNFVMSGWLRHSDTFIALDDARVHFSTPTESSMDRHAVSSYNSSHLAERDAREIFPSLKFFKVYSFTSAERTFKVPQQYAPDPMASNSILHMYLLHELIVAQVAPDYEYIVKGREDLYFFKPIPLDWRPNPKCDVTTKACLSWGGINMRLQWYTFSVGRALLSTRMRDSWKVTVKNPESFESAQVRLHSYTSCTVHQDTFSVAVTRYVSPYKRCFPKWEIGRSKAECVPTGCVVADCRYRVFEVNTTLCGEGRRVQP